jgi:hypothetical protein
MEYYSIIKNKILSFVGKGMELEIIMLGEHELRQTDMPCFLSNSEK